MRPAEAEEHIRKHGHAALYARHECRNEDCRFEWHCRQPQCRLACEGVLCRACEVEALLSEVLNVADALLPLLKYQEDNNEPWSASFAIAIKPRLQALRADAMRITQMERV